MLTNELQPLYKSEDVNSFKEFPGQVIPLINRKLKYKLIRSKDEIVSLPFKVISVTSIFFVLLINVITLYNTPVIRRRKGREVNSFHGIDDSNESASSDVRSIRFKSNLADDKI